MTAEELTNKSRESAAIIETVGKTEAANMMDIANAIISAYNRGNKVLVAGNGGSAADAQHISAELVSKFYRMRKALSAIALTTDTSILTSWANDENYDSVFARQIEAHGRKGDIFIALTTSGNSSNILKAVEKAKEQGIITVSLLGKDGGKMKGKCDYEIIVPSGDVARIQECHHVVYHLILEIVEKAFLE